MFFLLNNDYVCSTTKLNAIQYCGVQFSIDCLLTGIASAFQTPTLSLYLSQEIQVSPFLWACSIQLMPLLALS